METKKEPIKKQIAEMRRQPGVVMRAFEKRTAITERVVEDLKTTGHFFRTQEGLFYFENKTKPILLPIDTGSTALSALISERYGINPAERREYEHILAGLRHEALLRGEVVQIHRLAHYNLKTNRLYVSRFNGSVWLLDGDRIKSVPNGTDEVFFLDKVRWEPYEVKSEQTGLLDKLITGSANFSEVHGLSPSDQQWLLKVWLLALFFDTLHPTKPLLLICGEKGGGKTLTLRKCLRLLFGSGGEVSALERSKPDGFVATICSHPVAVFDNVDESISWLPDHLAQMATGVAFGRRKLYTTNDELVFNPQCFIALTSRTPKFIDGRDDVLDRTLILHTERRGEFVPEQALLREVGENRGALMAELLGLLNRIVAYIGAHGTNVGPVKSRMADFASFALLVARLEDRECTARRILESVDASRTDTLLEQEPIYPCLELWLQDNANQGRSVTSGELNKELAEIARQEAIPWSFKSGHALGQRLSNITTNLSEKLNIETQRDSSNQLHYCFWPKAESLKRAEPSIAAIQPPNYLSLGGLAA